MQKKQLRELKRINATPLMIKLAKENRTEKTYLNTEYNVYRLNTKYDMFIRCQSRGGLLMVCLFFPENLAKGIITPSYEIYLNPEGSEYITRVLDEKGKEESWSTAYIENLKTVFHKTYIGEPYSFGIKNADKRIWQNPEGKKQIQKFLGVKKRGWQGIMEFQHKARQHQILEAEKRQQKPWDDDMALIPGILPGFERWAKHDAADENFIFYNSVKDSTGWCSYCEKEVPVSHPRQNREGKCPCCRKKIIFKQKDKIQTLRTKRRTAEFIQKIGNGFCIRMFSITSAYRNRTYDNPDWGMQEEERYLFFNNGRTVHYTWGVYKNKCYRFIPNTGFFLPWNLKPKLYRKNMKSLKRTVLKTSAIKLWKKLPCSSSEYLYKEHRNPAVEMLARLGMFKLAEEVFKHYSDETLFDLKATELVKILKIDNARFRRLKEMDGSLTALKWLQLEKTADTMYPDEIISEYDKYDITSSSFYFLPVPLKIVKSYNYIKKQSEQSGETLRQTIITWRDYYNMAEQEKWNVASSQIMYPKNLKEAHAKVILYAKGQSIKKQAEKLENKWPEVNKILPRLAKFEYSSGKYMIIAPRSIEDMVREGETLSHCMSHADFYYDRIQKHEAYPFFLRKTASPEAPWYTLEVEASGNIRQKRTTGDNQNPDLNDALPFLQEFMREFKKRMTAEEIEQGKLANEQRIKDYKELRENGNRVWRGKFAGQLLADILEADFMEAL